MKQPAELPIEAKDEGDDYNGLPGCPRLVLRVGFAGARELSEKEQELTLESLTKVFHCMAGRLAQIVPNSPTRDPNAPRVADFYSPEPPLLRLITGLAEGGDTVAWEALQAAMTQCRVPADGRPGEPCHHVQGELAAVLPCAPAQYREGRKIKSRIHFDAQFAQCSYVLVPDGICFKPEDPKDDTALMKDRRARAYRAQSHLLIRQCDVLITATNPQAEAKAGGTLETLREAIAFNVPVIFVDVTNGNVTILRSRRDVSGLLSPSVSAKRATAMPLGPIGDLVRNLVLDAEPEAATDDAKHGEHGLSLLQEYLAELTIPGRAHGERVIRWRDWLWSLVTSFFKVPAKAKKDASLAPYAKWRTRAVNLNYHYSGLYRGTFLLNYTLAVVAVALAGTSLVLFSMKDPATGHPPTGVLIILALLKLGLLFIIFLSTRAANKQHWCDRAVDYRYLAERLRSMFYLPHTGSFQPPSAARSHYATRAVRQSAVDWLFDAIVRSVSPADLTVPSAKGEPPLAQRETFPFVEGGAKPITIVRLRPADALKRLYDHWIPVQTQYHQGNLRVMGKFNHFLDEAAQWLSLSVIVIVFADICALVAEIVAAESEAVETIAHFTPFLVLFTAVLPALVAGLGGLRFQAECSRLAERSTVMRRILWGDRDEAKSLADELEAHDKTPTDPGAWATDVLHFSETVASDFLHEVAEWSVLYAKELAEQ